MSSISENIKIQLVRQKMSIKELTKKTNLTRSQIDNIIYGRANKSETINKIAKALNIPVESLLSNSTLHNNNFDIDMYTKVISIINHYLKEYDLSISKNIMEQIATIVEKYKDEFKNQDELKLMIKGIILYIKEYLTICKPSDLI